MRPSTTKPAQSVDKEQLRQELLRLIMKTEAQRRRPTQTPDK